MEDNKIKISLWTSIILIIVVVLFVAGIVILVLNNLNKPIEPTSKNNTNATSTNISEIPNINEEPRKEIKKTEGVTIVPTMLDTITTDSSWCGTFQLVWNDMKNEVVKKDVVFDPQLKMVENLNKEDFNESMLSEDYYFKTFGFKSLELKEQIEKGIKEKFNQTSDIIDSFDWSDNNLNDPNNNEINRYFFYTMLYREFEFLKKFDNLDKDKFGDKYKDVEYFGIDNHTDNEVGNQIDVLYYNSKDDFAIVINTKTDDEVIFCKNPNGSTFNEIYENMNNESKNYIGSKSFEDSDEFKAPKLSFNEKREYDELANKQFITANNTIGEIEKAIQTIEFSLDEKGGKIKSEAAIGMMESMSMKNETEPRYFYVDDTFALFLREKGKEKPYFAGRIEDITKFQ